MAKSPKRRKRNKPAPRQAVDHRSPDSASSEGLAAAAERASATTDGDDKKPHDPGKAVRETVESIVVALILAFLFRAFEAEAFVIPTGSMAPTLRGQHKDLKCDQCGHWFQAGASEEGRSAEHPVIAAVCPMCRNQMEIQPNNAMMGTFSGDRILVSKFAYQLFDPQRWDIIVFKNPTNEKQNYIKRLIGLPGETIRIFHGDIFVYTPGDGEEPSGLDAPAEQFRIARKSPSKMRAMLSPVFDTRFIPDSLTALGWPSRFAAVDARGQFTENGWITEDGGKTFSFQLKNEGDEIAWLRYRHIPPPRDWSADRPPPAEVAADPMFGALVTDYYDYNADIARGAREFLHPQHPDEVFAAPVLLAQTGFHWVGDLALEADVQVKTDTGLLALDLVEGGVHHICRIDVATGIATLTRTGPETAFNSGAGAAAPQTLTAMTNLKGSGSYRVLFSNVDDQVRLFVNGRLAKWRVGDDGPEHEGTYPTRPDCRPRYAEDDPGDLMPVGIGAGGGLICAVNRLAVKRDVYYIAIDEETQPDSFGALVNIISEYPRSELVHLLPTQTEPGMANAEMMRIVLDSLRRAPAWNASRLFGLRREVRFYVAGDQFFPLGDNSPSSKDGRLFWDRPFGGVIPPDEERYVPRDYLIGKALFIYWPHPWPRPVWFTPNVGRMKIVR